MFFRRKNNVMIQVKKIAVYASKLTSILRKKTGIKSNLVLYEELFFFYFLNNVTLSLNDISADIISSITPKLFEVLETTSDIEYQTIKPIAKVICYKRFKSYYNIFDKYKHKFCADFFLEVFQYQSSLIIYIQENNTFSNLKSISLDDWIHNAANDNYLAFVNRILTDNIKLFLKFIKY